MMPIKVSGGSDGGSWMLMNGLLILKKYQFFYLFFSIIKFHQKLYGNHRLGSLTLIMEPLGLIAQW